MWQLGVAAALRFEGESLLFRRVMGAALLNHRWLTRKQAGFRLSGLLVCEWFFFPFFLVSFEFRFLMLEASLELVLVKRARQVSKTREVKETVPLVFERLHGTAKAGSQAKEMSDLLPPCSF